MLVKLSLLEMTGKANDWTYHSDEDQFTDVNADLQALAEMGKTYDKWEKPIGINQKINLQSAVRTLE